MRPTGNSRILQIHPTQRCNLRCLHCYSSSGPDEGNDISVGFFRQALSDASLEGYKVAGFSGGEPLVYKPLPELLEHAHQSGMITTVTSNGMLLDERRLEMLRDNVDLLAISLDGIPTSHNKNRASEQAFETMAARLEGVRQSGIPFGFIFTLTQHNLHELEWVAEFALEQGAKLLQIHPLEEVGRASETLQGNRPDEIELAYAFLEFLRIQAMAGDKLYVQLDLVNREQLRSNPDHFLADVLPRDRKNRLLSDLVSPLIIESDGTVVPIQHGFSHKYALGNLQEAPLRQLAARWQKERYQSFRDLCQCVFEEITTARGLPLTNWYDTITRSSQLAETQ